MACYRGYLAAQQLREAIDAALGGSPADRRVARRSGGPRCAAPAQPGDAGHPLRQHHEPRRGQETVVGLQQKLLFLLNVLQGADARPTTSTTDAVRRQSALVTDLEARWQALR